MQQISALSTSPLSGRWDDTTRWRFEISTTVPTAGVCASVGAIALDENGIHLTRTPRGYWELPGGHIEENETILQALDRELKEEVGLVFSRAVFIGSTIAESSVTIVNKASGAPYPNPGYLPHFVCFGTFVPGELGEEVVERRHVPFSELRLLDALELPERGILEMGLARAVTTPEIGFEAREAVLLYLSDRGFNLVLFSELAKIAGS